METTQKKKFNVSLVGAGRLLGKDVKLFLEEREFPIARLKLLDSETYEGAITEYNGEASLITKIEEDSFLYSDIIFLCCGGQEGKQYASFPRKEGSLLIDFSLTHAGREQAPVINCDINLESMRKGKGIVSSPQPISIILSNLLHPLDLAFGMERISVNVFQPVSDFGEEGIEELHQQTIKILSFSKIPKNVFGRQLAFNLIPGSMLSTRQREAAIDTAISQEVSEILGWRDRRLATRIIVAPVFFSHSFSIHLMLKSRPQSSQVNDVLNKIKCMKISTKGRGVTPVEATGERQMYVSESCEDGLSSGGFWLWIVSDHLRSDAALNAVRIAEAFISASSVN
ncbi:MAG: Asd/ArgC dimerization domain-containing protein [Acidobacteriota bacterium]